MKSNKFLMVAALVLALLFFSQFAAEVYLKSGPKPESGKIFHEPTFDLKDLSLSSRLHTESAYAWLEAGDNESSDAKIKNGMRLLRRVLDRNPLEYEAHYYLAKAYLRFSAVDNDYFDLGVRELKRAARIRGGNKQIAIDCGKIFFSIWSLLEDEDKTFAIRLLTGVMPVMSWPEFRLLVELWSFYVQDTTLLMDLLQRKPEFFGAAANQLVAAELPMELRHEFLALYEIHTLDSAERRYNELNLQGERNFIASQALLKQLLELKGYYRLRPTGGFNIDKKAKLQRSLLLQIISDLLTDPDSLPRLRDYLLVYIAEHSELTSLEELQKLLEEKNFFKSNDFQSLYLKTMIAFKRGSYGEIIAEVGSLRKTISFVKQEQLVDYTSILLLLVDSYYSTKLMTTAENVARELYENQPDNPDILWRVLRVQTIMGSEGPQDPVLKEKLIAVQNSRFVTVAKPNATYDVFLFNQPWIEIVMDPALLAQLKPKQLVQVFVDGKIAFENYVDAVPEKIAIGPKFVKIESKVKVQIIVI